ncbi:TubC N-terminal docking domain-related protein, partial [Pedobacter steynii]
MKDLLKKIRDNKVLVEVVDGKLKVFAKKGLIDAELIVEIKEKKDQLLSFLLNNDQSYFDGSLKSNIPRLIQDSSYVLSSSQRRLWLLSQFDGGDLAYNVMGAFVFEGELDKPAFAQSFTALI